MYFRKLIFDLLKVQFETEFFLDQLISKRFQIVNILLLSIAKINSGFICVLIFLLVFVFFGNKKLFLFLTFRGIDLQIINRYFLYVFRIVLHRRVTSSIYLFFLVLLRFLFNRKVFGFYFLGLFLCRLLSFGSQSQNLMNNHFISDSFRK